MIGQFFALRGSHRRSLDSLVRQVAEQCAPTVSALTAGRVDAMSVCETRGYIRARAGVLVRRHARAAMSRVPASSASLEPLVAARATERVVALVMRQMTSASWRAPVEPARTNVLRRAA